MTPVSPFHRAAWSRRFWDRGTMTLTNASGRREWIDAVRALCVLAIVLMHFQLWVFDATIFAYQPETRGWVDLNGFLTAFRMPALFVVSGMLVATRVRRGWGERRNRARAISSLYLYLVWLVFYAVFAAIFYRTLAPLSRLATQLLVPHGTLWFILFLAINVAVLTTLHRVHPAIVLGALAALSVFVLSLTVESPWEMLARGAYYMLFFAIGVYFRTAFLRFASGGLWWKVPATIVVLIVVVESLASVPLLGTAWFGLYLARDIVAVLCAVAITSAITLIRPVARALSYLGQRTLAIYVLHVPVIWVMVSIRNWTFGDAFEDSFVRMIAPVIGVAIIVAASLLIAHLLKRFRIGRALFQMPQSALDRLVGKSDLKV